MPQSFAAVHCHIVFSTKDHHPDLDDAVRPRTIEYLGGLCRSRHSPLMIGGGTRSNSTSGTSGNDLGRPFQSLEIMGCAFTGGSRPRLFSIRHCVAGFWNEKSGSRPSVAKKV